MADKKPVGWRKEPVRHGLAAKGIKTGRKRDFQMLLEDERIAREQRAKGVKTGRKDWRRSRTATGIRWKSPTFKVGNVYLEASISGGVYVYYWAVFETHPPEGTPMFVDGGNVSSLQLAQELAGEELSNAVKGAERVKGKTAQIVGG